MAIILIMFAYKLYKLYAYMDVRVKELCQQYGTTQKDLALKLGVSEMTLSRAARGNTSLPLLERIASALGVSVSELFAPQPTNTITCPHCGKPIRVEKGE
ncbi:helix-turn-helix transcriptional regulator [uncultured Rikenella sp.]|uniref:helix-turn-helix transcriptional regulator n=3 Tax=uncultured Rikenella sp. TaxID=368003 RepID=UPI00272A77C0|nr:helix-turn-helix transcriptional regulator [uncultured Rikenella sp.]